MRSIEELRHTSLNREEVAWLCDQAEEYSRLKVMEPRPKVQVDGERLWERWLEDYKEVLGQIRDKAESLLAATEMPMAPSVHIVGLVGGLKSIVRMIDEAGVPRA